MYPRILEPPGRQSFFLFGPRGVGKTAWVRARFPDALVFDLLESETYTRLLAGPSRLADQIPAAYKGWVVLDEIQRVPESSRRSVPGVPSMRPKRSAAPRSRPSSSRNCAP